MGRAQSNHRDSQYRERPPGSVLVVVALQQIFSNFPRISFLDYPRRASTCLREGGVSGHNLSGHF
jgi:hypothetical protein